MVPNVVVWFLFTSLISCPLLSAFELRQHQTAYGLVSFPTPHLLTVEADAG